eukprot:1160610-Pelagomonas_calceolata.AAC.16
MLISIRKKGGRTRGEHPKTPEISSDCIGFSISRNKKGVTSEQLQEAQSFLRMCAVRGQDKCTACGITLAQHKRVKCCSTCSSFAFSSPGELQTCYMDWAWDEGLQGLAYSPRLWLIWLWTRHGQTQSNTGKQIRAAILTCPMQNAHMATTPKQGRCPMSYRRLLRKCKVPQSGMQIGDDCKEVHSAKPRVQSGNDSTM